eukprot:jgi/Ulvmu1/8438/UM043_0016.1
MVLKSLTAPRCVLWRSPLPSRASASSRRCCRLYATGAYHPSQLLNLPGINVFLDVAVRGKSELLVPHASVVGVYSIDWRKLAALGFKGCVFDKDNTLTKPYSMSLEPGVQSSLALCSRTFNRNMVLLSNSAGLKGFDRDFSKAAAVEAALGVSVLRHSSKKPAGGTRELQERFGCEAHEIVCVGDRGLTDIVYGNRNGLLTIQVDPFDVEPESVAVRWARRQEARLLEAALTAGAMPPPHPLATQEQLREALGVATRPR